MQEYPSWKLELAVELSSKVVNTVVIRGWVGGNLLSPAVIKHFFLNHW